jgi:uncharacterized damage-inducible protein DinB
MLTHFRRFGAYNKWANARLYDACAQLPDSEYFQSRQAFFGSIHGVLNHMMVADTIWTSRLTGTSPALALDAQMYAELAALRRARVTMDDDIVSLLAAMNDGDMAGDVTYKTTSGDPFTMARSAILQHFFNHQTHHRGQAHDLLSQTGVAPPVFDLLYFMRE